MFLVVCGGFRLRKIMTKQNLLLIGAGGHTRSCIDVIEQTQQFSIIGLVGLAHEVGHSVLGYPVIGDENELPQLRAQCDVALVTLGQIKTAALRQKIFMQLQDLSFPLPTIISPHAYVSKHAVIGVGTIIMHGAIVNAGARIGNNCIINSHALIEHDVMVADHCHISTAAVLNGGVSVGSGTFIGSNTAIRQGVTIGNHCVIGMGQCVLSDYRDNAFVPALLRD